MKNKNRTQYIPLAEACQLTSYSPAYLKLRILQGKLKGKKIGRNWYTTEDWIAEYLQMHGAKNQIQDQTMRPTPPAAATVDAGNMRTVPLDDLLQLIAYPRAELIQALATGLLPGLKIGDEWYTRRDWLSSYIAEYGVKPEVVSFRAPVPQPAFVAPVVVQPVLAPITAAQAIISPVVPAPAPIIAQPVYVPPVVTVAPAPVLTPVLASAPVPEISYQKTDVGNRNQSSEIRETPVASRPKSHLFNGLLISGFRFLNRFPISVNRFLKSLPRPNFSFLNNKLFQRLTPPLRRASAGSLIAVLLAISFANNNVRASFYDWSQAVAKTTVAIVSKTSKQVATAVVQTTKTASHAVAVTAQQSAAIVGQATAAVTTAIADNSVAVLEQVPQLTGQALASTSSLVSGFYRSSVALADSLQTDITSSLASVSLPDFSLPSVSLPRLALPDINLPSVSLPDFSWPRLPNPLPAVGQAYSRAQGTAFRFFGRLENKLAISGQSGQVLGESTSARGGQAPLAVSETPLPSASTPPPTPSSKRRGLFDSILSPLSAAINFLNPSSPSSLIARLSGSVSEIGQTIRQADPLTKVSSSVTSFLSTINVAKVLQPAGSFLARLKSAPAATPDTTLYPPEAERSGGQAPDTTVSGELSLQPAASLTPDQEVAVLPTNPADSATPADRSAGRQSAPIRYTSPARAQASGGPATTGTLTVSPSLPAQNLGGYFTITDPSTLQTAKTIHTLANLIADSTLSAHDLKVATAADGTGGDATIQGSLRVAGTATLQSLAVNKDLTVIGTLTASSFNPQSLTTGPIIAGSVSANSISASSLTATSAVSGKSISGTFGSFDQLSANSLAFGGGSSDTFLSKSPSTFQSSLTAQSTLSVTGAATLASTLAVTGASTFTGALTANGGITLTGALSTSATSTAAAFVSTDSTATSTLAGNLQINGNTNITGTSTLATTTLPQLSITSTTATTTISTGGLAIGTNQFLVQQTSGRVGIATSTPGAIFAVTGNSLFDGSLSIFGLATASTFNATSTTATSTISGGLAIETSGLVYDYQTNRVGIGTASPLSALHIQNTTSPQFTLAYDGANFLTLDVSSSGVTTLNSKGSLTADFLFSDNIRIATTTTTQLSSGYDTTNYLAFQTDSSGTTTLNAIGGLNASIVAVDPFRISTSSSVAFEVRDGISNNQVFTINARAGSVAIGSSTPTALYALQVASTSATQFLLGYDTTNNYYTTQISSQGQVTFVRRGLTVLAQGFTFQDTLNVATSTTETVLTVNSTNTSHDTSTLAVYEQGLGRAFYIQRTNASYATSSAAEIVTASSTALSLISQSNSASSTLAVYQQGSNGPIVLFTDTNASTTPAFRIAAVTRDVEVREDYVQRSHSDLTALTNINDVYIYDTTKDTDGGKWRNNDKAQSSSWYNETLDNTAASCTLDTDDRCGRKEFPEKAILVVTNSDLFIFDGKDNSQWMNFDEGSTASSTMSIIGGTSSTHASVTALNGTIYIANSASTYDGGVVAIDFPKDTAYFYGNVTNGELKYNSNISNRNSTSLGYTTLKASLSLVDDNVNDVWAQSVCSGGLSLGNQKTAQEWTASGEDEYDLTSSPSASQRITDADSIAYQKDSSSGEGEQGSRTLFPSPGTYRFSIDGASAGALLSDASSRRRTEQYIINKNTPTNSEGAFDDPAFGIRASIENQIHNSISKNFVKQAVDKALASAMRSFDSAIASLRMTVIPTAHAATQACKTYIAVATDSGVSLLNETDQTIVDFNINSSDDSNNVTLSPDGTLYYDTETAQTVNVFKNAHLRGGDMVVAGTADMVFSTTSQPAIFTSAQTINDLFLIPTSSFVDNKKGNTLFIGHNAGLTKLSENTASSTQASVKYYQTATTTEEMIGDIRGMWPFSDSTQANPADASIKANTSTGTNISSADYVTGVRGTGISLDGSTEYVSVTDSSALKPTTVSVGAWFYVNALPGANSNPAIIDRTNADTADGYRILLLSTNAIETDVWAPTAVSAVSNTFFATGQWYFVVTTYNSAGVLKFYVNGAQDVTTQSPGGNITYTTTTNLGIGHRTTGSGQYFNGTIDEPFVTATVLSPSQIKYMYETGKKALESHTSGRITGISGADSYQQLYGTSNTVKAISVDLENNLLYVGTNSSGDTGGVSVLGLNSDSLVDIYGSDANKNDDDYTQWTTTTDYDDIVSLSVSSRYPKTIVIASEASLWLETEQFSLDKYRSQTVNPHGETLTQTNLTVNYKLDVGNELAVYGSVLGASDTRLSGGSAQNNLKPTFKVSSDGTVTVRDDLLFTGRTTLTSLSNINDIYVYDTAKDSDGGEWTCNDIARATSWYNEPLNTATRGKTRCFPRKAIVVSASGATGFIYIYDAKDNSMWMRFNTGGGATAINTTISSTFMLNGSMYLGGAGNPLDIVSFKNDTIYVLSTSGYHRINSTIAARNDGYSLTTVNSSYAIVNNAVNDVQAAVVNGKTYVAVATDGGVSIINENDSTVINILRTADLAGTAQKRVVLLSNGDLYSQTDYTGDNNHFSNAYYKVQNLTASESSWAQYRNKSYDQTTGTPALIGGSTTKFSNIFATPGTSPIDSSSNTIYLATSAGLTVLQEKQGDETNGSVKYYTKDYISEEMIGDIRGMWGFGNYADINPDDYSVKANELTGVSIAGADYVSGVRGWALDLDGSAEYATRTSDTDFNYGTASVTLCGWLKTNTATNPAGGYYLMSSYTNPDIIALRFVTDGTMEFILSDDNGAVVDAAISVADYYDANWHYFCGVKTGTSKLELFVDGVLSATDASLTETGSIDPSNIAIGSLIGGSSFLPGLIDEPMVTAEALTASQIKRMYETGKRALEGGIEGVASSATSAHSAFRIGVAAGAVHYTAGQFIGSVIQVYDGPGSATSTRFVTQTASSTSDYYIQFSPDHSASTADGDTFSIGPNALQGDSNRVTALAVDDTRDFIYIGTTSGTGTQGMVTKIALDSDTVTDVWHPSVGKLDDASQPYNTASTTAISLAGNTLAIGANDSSNGGLWSEYLPETLEHKLSGPKSVFTVIDKLQTPNITSVTGNLTISSATSTSLTIGTATTTANTIQIKAGPSQNLLLSGDSNNGVYIASGGNVGIGVTSPSYSLDTSGRIYSSFESNTLPSVLLGSYGFVGEFNTTNPITYIGNSYSSGLFHIRIGGAAESNTKVTVNSSGNVIITGNCSDAAGGGGCTADYAEVYLRDLNDTAMAKTDILALDTITGKVTRADKAKGKTNLLGVYSSAPGSLIGQRKNSIQLGVGKGVMDDLDPDEIPVALVGRVPVKVNLKGGEIKIGDAIGLSSVPGEGMKISQGQSIGIALQAYNKNSKTDTIEVFVRLSYLYDDSFVPIWDGKINEVVGEIRALRKEVEKRFEKLEKEVGEIKKKVK